MGMQAHLFSRRQFLQSTGAATALAAAAPANLFAAESYGGKKIPFALQLYSVRNECAKDLPGTVTAVAKMGYKAVEFAGYHGRDAKPLRALLDEVGLKCCGTHIGLDTLLGDNLAKTLEFNRILGNPFLIVPSLPEKYRKTRQAWQDAADLFNEISERVKPHGMRLGYHNHKHPGRVASVHVKPFSKAKPNALIGDDELPWKVIFNLCETVAGVEWYIIEYESDAYPPLVSVEKTLAVMRRWGKC